jgi:iron complex outermembrane receptor protein
MAGRISYGNYVYNNIFSDRALYQSLYNQSGFINNLPTAVNETQFANPQYFSSHYIENASFFRMDNMSLGYNVNEFFTEKLKARFSLTVQNAFTVTNYSGLDPEVTGGIDNNIYPRPRVFLFGFNLTL